MRPVGVAVAAIVVGVRGIRVPDTELRVRRHLEADAPGPCVIRVDVHAVGRAALHRQLQAAIALRTHRGMAVKVADQLRRRRVLT